MAEKSSRLADILKQEYKSKGIVGGLASATGKRVLEKLDIRNALFGGSGVGSLVGRKIFGKGYSAINEKSPADKISSQSAPILAAQSDKLDVISMNTQITAKNSMALPSMARDMNVMRQNIIKMVKLQGGTPTNKADAFFSKSKDREAMYENLFKKDKTTTPTKVETKKDEGGLASFVTKLLGPIGLIVAGLVSAVQTGISALKTSFDVFKSALGGLAEWILKNILGKSIPTPTPTAPAAAGGALATGVVSGVALGGAAATVAATSIMASESQKANRKALQENSMLGAMGGDTSFASAILDAQENAREEKDRINAQRMKAYKSRAGVGRDTSPSKEIDPGKRQILDFIGNKEGGPAQYNALVYGNNTPKSADLTNMTIDEVLNYQSGMRARGHASTAVGRYQFLKGTLEDLVRQSGIPTSTKFTPDVQDQLAGLLVDRAGYQEFKDGKIGLEQFQSKLAGTWASLPKADGTSEYAGIAGNKVLTSASALQNVLMASAGGTSGGRLSESSTQVATLTREALIPQSPNINISAPQAQQNQQQQAPVTIAAADVMDTDFGKLLARMY
jgi:muramidase (phage lysozyme)